jgi:hypothetical protein
MGCLAISKRSRPRPFPDERRAKRKQGYGRGEQFGFPKMQEKSSNSPDLQRPPVGRDSTIITRPSRRRIARSMKFIFACQLKITRGDVGGGAPGVPFTHPRKACGGNSSAAYSLGAMQSGATPLVHADASADGRVQKGSGPGGFLRADSQLDIGKSTASSGRLWHERFISRALLQ